MDLGPWLLAVGCTSRSGIDSMEDFRENNRSRPKGSTAEATVMNLLEISGLKAGEDYKVVALTYPDAVEEMKDGKVDVLAVISYPPQSSIMDLASLKPIKLIDIPDSVIEDYLAVTPGFSKTVFKKEWAYEGQVNVEDVNTIGVRGVLVSHTGIPEEVIYEATKHLFDNMDEFHKGNAVNKSVTLETALEGMNVPLHLGAQKYYESIGMDIPPEIVSTEIK